MIPQSHCYNLYRSTCGDSESGDSKYEMNECGDG
jgi:hypothetical protein